FAVRHGHQGSAGDWRQGVLRQRSGQTNEPGKPPAGDCRVRFGQRERRQIGDRGCSVCQEGLDQRIFRRQSG
ncbi:hypothetical protein WICPIJ_006745, partial [Wickerhamomyces pijperi]